MLELGARGGRACSTRSASTFAVMGWSMGGQYAVVGATMVSGDEVRGAHGADALRPSGRARTGSRPMVPSSVTKVSMRSRECHAKLRANCTVRLREYLA